MPYKDPKDPRRKEASRRYRKKNPNAHRVSVKARKEKLREQWRIFKSTLKCALCDENHPNTLDFHHVVRNSDKRPVHRLVRDGMFTQAIAEVREKCVVLCSNHHRKGHYYEHHGIPLDEPNYHQYEEWFRIKSTKTLDT
jgi:hypothetical protein